MSTEEGTIIRVEDDRAWVQVKRSTMCESCKHRQTCHSLTDARDMEAEAINTAGGKVGDRVLLKIAAGSLVKISFILYLVPVIAFIAGAVVGMELPPPLKINPEVFSFFMGIAGCAVSFIVIRFLSFRMSKNSSFVPEVVKLLAAGDHQNSGEC